MNPLNRYFNMPTQRKFWAVSVGHFTNDILMQMSGAVLLTFLSANILPMSNTQIGFALTAQQFTGAIAQPLFGLRADKTGGRKIGTGGLLFTVLGFSLALLVAISTRNYYLMLIPYILQGIGSGALHPVGALHAVEADEKRAASSTAYFFLLGQLGLGLGPAIIGLLLDFGSHGGTIPLFNILIPTVDGAEIKNTLVNFAPMFLVALAAIPSIIFMYMGIPAERKRKRDDGIETAQAKPEFSLAFWMPFIILAVMVILRSLPNLGSVNFIPKLFQQKGWEPTQYGFITSIYWFSSGFAGVFFGNLADRFDRRLVVMGSILLTAPPLFLLPLVDGFAAILLAILAGWFSGGSHSIIIVLAQELLPNSKAFAAGAALGFIFGAGALGNLIIGVISDSIGLPATFQIMAVTAIIAAFTALLLPKSQPRIVKEAA